MKTITRSALLSLILAFVVLSAFSTQRKPFKNQVTGIYSNMIYVEEAGDVVGMEIFVVASSGGYHAVVQIAEGAPEEPFVVNVEVKGSDIEFVAPSILGKYKGRVSAKGLAGKFENEESVSFLKRRNSYWQ